MLNVFWLNKMKYNFFIILFFFLSPHILFAYELCDDGTHCEETGAHCGIEVVCDGIDYVTCIANPQSQTQYIKCFIHDGTGPYVMFSFEFGNYYVDATGNEPIGGDVGYSISDPVPLGDAVVPSIIFMLGYAGFIFYRKRKARL